jgi:Flp pilus assembly pilin Flp
MSRIRDKIQRLLVAGLIGPDLAALRREEGQTFVEYVIILSLVSAAMIGALTFLHDQIAGLYTQINNDFSAALP